MFKILQKAMQLEPDFDMKPICVDLGYGVRTKKGPALRGPFHREWCLWC